MKRLTSQLSIQRFSHLTNWWIPSNLAEMESSPLCLIVEPLRPRTLRMYSKAAPPLCKLRVFTFAGMVFSVALRVSWNGQRFLPRALPSGPLRQRSPSDFSVRSFAHGHWPSSYLENNTKHQSWHGSTRVYRQLILWIIKGTGDCFWAPLLGSFCIDNSPQLGSRSEYFFQEVLSAFSQLRWPRCMSPNSNYNNYTPHIQPLYSSSIALLFQVKCQKMVRTLANEAWQFLTKYSSPIINNSPPL